MASNGTIDERRERTGFSRPRANLTALPPHSMEAEQGVLGCILLGGIETLSKAVEYFRPHVPFYDLKHTMVFQAFCRVAAKDESAVADVIALREELRDAGQLEQVGGDAWLAKLPDMTPSAANIDYYLKIVWEKYLARRVGEAGYDAFSQATGEGEFTPQMLEGIQARFELLRQLQSRGDLAPAQRPKHLKTLESYLEAYHDRWFGTMAGEPGHELPFGFPFKIRRGEQTFFVAEKGAGKTTLMSYITLHCLAKDEKVCVASMETRPANTLHLMAVQLLGTKELPDSDEGRERAKEAYNWLSKRVVIYDFLGIADWRDILSCFEYAAAHMGCTMFVIDSIMRIGLLEDDMAGHGIASASFAQFAQQRNVILWIINHLNKAKEGNVARRSRGSNRWIDNSANVVSVHLNEKKQPAIDKHWSEWNLELDKRSKKIQGLRQRGNEDAVNREEADLQRARGEFESELKTLKEEYDSWFDLHNQRWEGSRQNARVYLYFQRTSSLQFHDEGPYEPAKNWLKEWGPAGKGTKGTEGTKE